MDHKVDAPAQLSVSNTILVRAYQSLSLIVRLRFLRRFTCVHHTNYLVLIRLRDYQRGTLLTISTPHADACFAPLSGSLFIQIPRFTEWHRWFPTLLFKRENNFY